MEFAPGKTNDRQSEHPLQIVTAPGDAQRAVPRSRRSGYRFSLGQTLARLVLALPGFLAGCAVADIWFVATHSRPAGGLSFEAWLVSYRGCQFMGAFVGASLAMAIPSAVVLFVQACRESDRIQPVYDPNVESMKFTARVDLTCLLVGAAMAVLACAFS